MGKLKKAGLYLERSPYRRGIYTNEESYIQTMSVILLEWPVKTLTVLLVSVSTT